MVEIQVRTVLQHLWAQLSEVLSDLLDPGIKYGGGDSETKDVLSSFSTAVGSLEEMELRGGAALQVFPVAEFKQSHRQLLENAIATIAGLKTQRGK